MFFPTFRFLMNLLPAAGQKRANKIEKAKPRVHILEDRTVLTTILDLGTLGPPGSSTAYGINAFGQVVGASTQVSDPNRPFRTAPDQPINPATDDLGTLGGRGSDSILAAYSINASGQAAGTSIAVGGSAHAFRTSANQPIHRATDDLGTLLQGGTSYAWGINASGQVVGSSGVRPPADYHAFRTAPNQPINPATDDLGTLGGGQYSMAYGINDAGQVVGVADTVSGVNHAFRTAPNQPINPATDDLGTLTGDHESYAYGINAAGQVVGSSVTLSYDHHAFLWQSGQGMSDLGTLARGGNSDAYSINDAGQVVGRSAVALSQYHAFLYSNGTMIDLNSLLPPGSGWVLREARGINNAEQIVGTGSHNGLTRAFLLTVNAAATIITPTSPQWVNKRGAIDYSYQVSGAAVPQHTTVALYWSSSTRFADRIGGAIAGTSTTITAGTPVGTYGPYRVSASRLQNVPQGATNLLVVTDPDNILGNFSEANNVKPVPVRQVYTPSQIKTAYGIDHIPLFGGTMTPDGTGQTIVIVSAYDNRDLASDLTTFDARFGLPDPPSFVQLNQDGQLPLPAPDMTPKGIWAREDAIDVEWAHAIAPRANIILIECNSDTASDLFAGVRTAHSFIDASVVSLSWGGVEGISFSGEDEQTFDRDLMAPGVTFVAESGDHGSPGDYPAYSPGVLAVGGSSLTLQPDGSYDSEVGWSLDMGNPKRFASGGGVSLYELEQSYQFDVQTTGARTIPDVAFDADLATGVYLYDSYNEAHNHGSPWTVGDGTSLGAPCWAALIAIVNQGRMAAGGMPLDGVSQTLPALYQLDSSDFHHNLGGYNGTTSDGLIDSTSYDEITGRGTPMANLLVPDLVAYELTAPGSHISHRRIASEVIVSTKPTGEQAVFTFGPLAAGLPFILTAKVEDAMSNTILGYPWAVGLPPSGSPAASIFVAHEQAEYTSSGLLPTPVESNTITRTATLKPTRRGQPSSLFQVVAAAATDAALSTQLRDLVFGADGGVLPDLSFVRDRVLLA